MNSFEYTITAESGMHARPAGMLVKAMQAFESDITVSLGEKTASCKKLFALMGLGAKRGSAVSVSAEGPDAEAAIAAARDFFHEHL